MPGEWSSRMNWLHNFCGLGSTKKPVKKVKKCLAPNCATRYLVLVIYTYISLIYTYFMSQFVNYFFAFIIAAIPRVKKFEDVTVAQIDPPSAEFFRRAAKTVNRRQAAAEKRRQRVPPPEQLIPPTE